ncbi:hypothetical protein AUJ66_08685 [Candidatus Desantisbacteria bacterium CG1_02_38_46]|uniref:Fis family transcriptional regulator n=2 Tax=unclassified Candidatus Desantisiibacteriota TaxID=3106372 RepID=A0A2H9PC79_9BACT|nr:MAG: hypothetical protein AUJ66_08685 [Candidatus Desantisbacteria bacterium CG1_02_38_46]PIZ15830.1 MAG: hypothetical protein COY51_04115 [Candidatus Desantisbacteria bacterium CG_4_10_14_0_8_um_filter_39_17]
MDEVGRVIEIKGNMAKVEVAQKEVCHKCPSASFCKLATGDSRIIEAANEIGAKVGQLVKIEIGSGNILASAFLVYIFPIIALLIAGGLTQWISSSQNMAIIIGMSAMAFSFLIVRSFDKRMNKSRKIRPEGLSYVTQDFSPEARKLIPTVKEIVSGG